jgi:hypothetical protein
MGRSLTIYPVRLSHCSRMHRERERSSSPWYLLTSITKDDRIKKNDRTKPRKTPRKINTDSGSMEIVVFTFRFVMAWSGRDKACLVSTHRIYPIHVFPPVFSSRFLRSFPWVQTLKGRSGTCFSHHILLQAYPLSLPCSHIQQRRGLNPSFFP